MSKKSVKQKINVPSNTTKIDILACQKKIIKRAAVDFLAVAIMFLTVASIVLIVALTLEDKEHANRILFIAFPGLLAFCVVFAAFAIKRFSMFSSLDRLATDCSETIKFDCKTFRYITYAKSKFHSEIIGIVFKDAERQKFIYILPEPIYDCKTVREQIRRKCVGKQVETECYYDTYFVKSVKDFEISE